MGTSALFLVRSMNSPSTRYRVLQYLPFLRGAGWTVTVCPCTPTLDVPHRNGAHPVTPDGPAFFPRLQNRFFAALRARSHDVVFIQRELLPPLTPLLEQLIHRLNTAIVFDFDDSQWLQYGRRKVNPMATVVRLSSAVIAGNEFLAEWALKHNDNVWVLPTPIDTDRFVPAETPGSGNVLVWSGRSANLHTLLQTRDAFIETAKRHPDLRLRIICDRPPDFDPGLPVEFLPWSSQTEVEGVRTADIGIMPLANNEWTLGRTGYKVLQYMACALPTIAAPWGVISDVLDAGRCGLPAQDTDEWVEALDRLLSSTDRRLNMGLAARQWTEQIYALKVMYPRWSEVLQTAADQRRAALRK